MITKGFESPQDEDRGINTTFGPQVIAALGDSVVRPVRSNQPMRESWKVSPFPEIASRKAHECLIDGTEGFSFLHLNRSVDKGKGASHP